MSSICQNYVPMQEPLVRRFARVVFVYRYKGHSLDKSVPSNYRPISNLNFISKILERLFLWRFQSHILNSPNFNNLMLH